MMVAMAVHSEDQGQSIYHVTSSLRNPAPYAVLADSGGRYFLHNPPCSKKNGEPVRLSRMRFFRTLPRFRAYMAVKFRLPLEVFISCLLISTTLLECDHMINNVILPSEIKHTDNCMLFDSPCMA
jgi:hypothetical protein